MILIRALSGLVGMPHSDDDIALFVSGFDIPMRFNHLLQWIASVYDRLELSFLNQLGEEVEIFDFLTG